MGLRLVRVLSCCWFWWFGHSYGQTIPALLFRPVQYSESDMFGGDMLVFFSSGGDQGAASEMVGSAYEQERAGVARCLCARGVVDPRAASHRSPC